MNQGITRMITLLARKSQCCISERLKRFDLTAAEQPFFMALHHYEGITQEELTAIVCVDKAATARAVKSLEGKGYVERIQDERDRRQNRIYPTVKLHDHYPAVEAELLSLNGAVTKGLSGEEQDMIYETLKLMEKNFAAIAESGRGNGVTRQEKKGGQAAKCPAAAR